MQFSLRVSKSKEKLVRDIRRTENCAPFDLKRTLKTACAAVSSFRLFRYGLLTETPIEKTIFKRGSAANRTATIL